MTDREADQTPADIPGGVAIIGMAGRWPGANTADEFWRNLCAGVESITRFQDSELEDSFGAEIPNSLECTPKRRS
jgi:acyl transferase domain-containing protein